MHLGLVAYYQQLQEYYNGAKFYYNDDTLRRQLHDEPTSGFGFVRPMLDLARTVLAGKHVIDVGCGIGNWCRALSPVAKVTGVDFSPHLIDIAREGTTAVNVDFLVDDVLQLSQVSGPFEGAIHFNLFNHVPWVEWSRFIETLHSKLRPGSPVVMGAQRMGAENRRELLTWIDDVADPVQHNERGDRVYYVVENTFDEVLLAKAFQGYADDLRVEILPPPPGGAGKCGAWYATYRVR